MNDTKARELALKSMYLFVSKYKLPINRIGVCISEREKSIEIISKNNKSHHRPFEISKEIRYLTRYIMD